MLFEKVMELEESKKDEQNLIDWAGEDLARRFLAIKNRVKPPQNDLYFWIDNYTTDFFDEFITSIEQQKTRKQKQDIAREGAELIYQDEDWKVYHIKTYEASCKYGKNTQWCISGSKRWANGGDPAQHFNNYKSKGTEFYFYINKDGSKYAMSVLGNTNILYDAEDNEIEEIPNAPIIDSIPVPGAKLSLDDLHIVDNTYTINYNTFAQSQQNLKFIKQSLIDLAVDTIILEQSYEEFPVHIVKHIIPTSVKKLIFKDGIKIIPSSLASHLTELEAVVLPLSLKSIKNSAFAGCSSLREVILPENVSDFGRGVFNNCSSLTNVIFNCSLLTLPDLTFSGCSSLNRIMLPEKLAIIGDMCFSKCYSLKNINLPQSVTKIGQSAFLDSGLVSITIPQNVKVIAPGCFMGCANLVQINLPQSLVGVYGNAFSECTNIEYVELPDTVQFIGKSAFEDCINLLKINTPKQLLKLATNAFDGCSKLKYIPTVLVKENYEVVDYLEYALNEDITEFIIRK